METAVYCTHGRWSLAGINRIARRAATIAAIVAFQVLPQPVSAVPVDWSDSILFQARGGLENPLVAVAFNPQPEPPAYGGTQTSQENGVAVMTAPNVDNPQMFQLLLSINLGSAAGGPQNANVFYPPDPIAPFPSLQYSIATSLGTVLVDLDFSTSSGGIGSDVDAVAFNPQPEPPAFSSGQSSSFGLEFAFTALSDATVRIGLTLENGEQLHLTQVPEPAALVLFTAGLVFVAMSRRKNATGAQSS